MKLNQAASEYQTAIRLAPKDALPHTALGNVLKDEGQLEQAAAEYREAERLRSSGAPQEGFDRSRQLVDR